MELEGKAAAKALADNLGALWPRDEATGAPYGEARVAKEIGVGTSGIRRALGKEDGVVTLQSLQKIADYLQLAPWQLLHPAGAEARSTGLKDQEVRSLAGMIDRIVTTDPDPVRREWAIQLMRLAVGSPPPGQVGILEVVTELARALQATQPHVPQT